ncbi:MAG: hypothetical protein IPF67_12450 [Saprospiraceae bacterium]|nr:hypothetical protein [Candidatus Brachybacter algidus]
MTLKDFFKEVSDQVRQSFKLLLDTELVLELTSKSTEKSYDVVITKAGLNDEFLNKFRTQISEDFMITKSVASIENDSNLDNYTLHQIGIPPLAIVDIETKDDILHIELSKDLSKYTLLNN